MPTNLEIKAKYRSPTKAERIARAIGAVHHGVLQQTDMYFILGQNRLKLREIKGEGAELIWYERPDKKGSRYSNYRVRPVSNVEGVKRLFSSLFGVRSVVRKRRILYLYMNARIHIDIVTRLGTFLEFEVLVKKGRPQAVALMKYLRKEFGIRVSDVIGVSYSDMSSGKSGRKSGV